LEINTNWLINEENWSSIKAVISLEATRIRRGNDAEVMNTFRKLALNIVRNDNTRKASMKRKLKMATLDDDFRAELLLGES